MTTAGTETTILSAPQKARGPAVPPRPVRVHVHLPGDEAPARLLAALDGDSRFEGFNGRVAASQRVDVCICQARPERQVCLRPAAEAIVRTLHMAPCPDETALLDALRAGAWGFLPANAREQDVIAVVAKLARGECQALEVAARLPGVAHSVLAAVGGRHASPANPRARSSKSPLSRREMQVLRAIAEGESTRAIADDLGLALQTVKNHVTAIMNKTGAGTRAQAAAVAASRGWLAGLA